jgi:hypothetical protein
MIPIITVCMPNNTKINYIEMNVTIKKAAYMGAIAEPL